MPRQVSIGTKTDILRAVRERYLNAKRSSKARILDELVAITGYHRKHAIRILRQDADSVQSDVIRGRTRIYDEAVRESLVVVWEVADRVCGRRLKAIVPCLIDSMERHGHLRLDPVVRNKLLTVSVPTIDRLLRTAKEKTKCSHRRRKRPNALVKQGVPVRTFADWKDEPPGFCEADFVAHNGGESSGACIHTLVATDLATGWTEALPLLSRHETLVTEALEVLRSQLPFPLLGLDFDNDSTLMNESVLRYCRGHEITITRSREYRKNDQAWIEQKNGAVIRRTVGHGRFSGVVAAHTLGRLYRLSRLYVNFFQPSQKLRSKTREGARVRKMYFTAATPYERVLKSDRISESIKEELRARWRTLDPVRLLHDIRELQAALCALALPPGSSYGEAPASQSLEKFLASLPHLWKEGDARPTHRTKSPSTRYWRTRIDPFKEVWPKVLSWLQETPDVTAKDLFMKLQHLHPERFPAGQLRSLQRRIREWRQAMARELIYAGVAEIVSDQGRLLPDGNLSGNIPK